MKQFTSKNELNAYLSSGIEELEESGVAWVVTVDLGEQPLGGYVLSDSEKQSQGMGDPILGDVDFALYTLSLQEGNECTVTLYRASFLEDVSVLLSVTGTYQNDVFCGTIKFFK